MGYSIAQANEYLVITGGGIQDLSINKKAWVMPWQKCTKISVSPFDLALNLQAMTIEKLQFALPAVFTIGPDNDVEALKKYALLLSGNNRDGSERTQGHVMDIVKGIIEGETRVIVSSMTMEEIFKERQVFKTKVIENVQNELQQFGLRIYNANVKELQDTPGSEYFAFLSRKAHEGALNQAKIDVAEARMRGEIGEAEKKGRTKQEISRIDAETAVLETKRKADKAKADSELTNRQTELEKDIRLAKITAQRQTEMRDAELQKAVETKRAETELERLRATDVTKSKIARESAQQKSDAAFYTEQRQADAHIYRQKIEADALLYRQNKEADALLYRQSKEADADFYRRKRDAEGLIEMAKAYGAMAEVLGGPQGFLQLKMLETGTYEKLAKANATAIKDMQPKITSWTTGNIGAGDAGADNLSSIRNIMQSLPPLFGTIYEQTGIAPPNWMAQMPKTGSNLPSKVDGQSQGKLAGINGTS